MTIYYHYRCRYTGDEYRVRVTGVDCVTDEPYPPGGTLRVLRNAEGKIIAGPLVEELLHYEEVEE